jgi:2-polyprenyl-3-methyl-5-hydroxy-6-metoxy-1,4-benzoquinol methylase
MSISQPYEGACRVCGQLGLIKHFSVGSHLLVRCIHCNFIQVAEHPSKTTLTEIYNEAYFTHSKYRDLDALSRENNRRMALIRAYLPLGSSLLDAGCSTGDFIEQAKSEFVVSGCDLSEFAISIAKKKNSDIQHRLWTGILENLEGNAESYDAICLWDVIEHVWNPIKVFDQLFHRLKPGGIVFLSTPSIDASIARCMGRYWAFMTPPEHLGFFTAKTFRFIFAHRLPGEILYMNRRGKWANIGFIAYKARRIAPKLVPVWLVSYLEGTWLGRMAVYVPTGDIRYLAVRKSTL